MKVRIGYALGARRGLDGHRLGALAEGLERHGYDSLWLSERVTGPAPDPLLALGYVAGRTQRIKLGTSVQVLPGRNPALLAKAWATLDLLSGGRALPAFGLGVVDPREQQAFGVARTDRVPWLEEVLPLLRRLWTEDDVHHEGRRFRYEGLTISPKPGRRLLDVWLGGRAPSELRRIGRLADGWLASFATPEQCRDGRAAIEDAAAAAGRAIDPEHFGAMLLYGHAPPPEPLARAIAARNPAVDPASLVATGWEALAERIAAYVAVGCSKLVLVPVHEPPDWDDELAAGAAALLPLQT